MCSTDWPQTFESSWLRLSSAGVRYGHYIPACFASEFHMDTNLLGKFLFHLWIIESVGERTRPWLGIVLGPALKTLPMT